MSYLHVWIVRLGLGYLLVTGAAAVAGETLASIHAELEANFTFVSQGDEDRPRLVSGDTPFSGDCDDLAFAAYGRLWRAGLEPQIWIVQPAYAPQRHMVTCAGGLCIDTNRSGLVSQLRLRLEYSKWRRARASENWVENQLSHQLAVSLR